MSSDSQGVAKAEVRLKWDPSPWDQPPHHLDIIAATYSADAPYGPPVYVVHFDSAGFPYYRAGGTVRYVPRSQPRYHDYMRRRPRYHRHY